MQIKPEVRRRFGDEWSDAVASSLLAREEAGWRIVQTGAVLKFAPPPGRVYNREARERGGGVTETP